MVFFYLFKLTLYIIGHIIRFYFNITIYDEAKLLC